MKRRLCLLLTMSLIMTSLGGLTVYGENEAAASAIEQVEQKDAAISDVSRDSVPDETEEVTPLDGEETVSGDESEAELSADDFCSEEYVFMNEAPRATLSVEDGIEELSTGGAFYMKSGDLSKAKLSQQEIISRYKAIPAVTTTSPERFATEPSSVSPYALGSLSSDYQNASLAYLNYIRALAGVKKVSLNSGLSKAAQNAALVNAANKSLSHTPSRPSGMSDSLYKPGYAAAGSSNLYSNTNRANSTLMKTALISYMDDYNSPSNLACLGHRRWMLLPNLANTGFGQAEKGTYAYAAMKVFKSGYDSTNPADSSSVDYDFISWPSSGNFPIVNSSFGENAENLVKKKVPWSVTLNPKRYKAPSASALTITVTRQSDDKTWVFNKNNITTSPNSNTQKYLTVENSGYGVANCIIFNLGTDFTDAAYNRRTGTSEREELFTVSISGLKTSSGAATTLNYCINFFDLNNPDTSSKYYASAEEFESESTLVPADDPYDPSELPAPKDTIETENKAVLNASFYVGGGLYHQMTLETGDAISLASVEGKNLIAPSASAAGLSDEDYGFAGWYTEEPLPDGNGDYIPAGSAFYDGTRIADHTNVYALFRKRPAEVKDISESATALIVGSISPSTYTGEEITPLPTVKAGITPLVLGEDYLLSYQNNVDVGTATVTITGIGKYKGTKTTTFSIAKCPLSSTDIWFEDLVGLDTMFGMSQDEMKACLRGHFMSSIGPLTAGSDFTIGNVSSTDLKSGCKVTVTVNAAPDSNYSGYMTCTFLGVPSTGDAISMCDPQLADSVELGMNAAYDAERGCYVYTGKAIKPSVVIPGLSKKNYKVKYKNNTNAGIGCIMITGKGKYKGTLRKYFVIGKKDIGAGRLTGIKRATYKGTAQRMKFKLIIVGGGKKMKPKAGRDYLTTYSDPVNAGTCSITLQGRGNFMGTLSGVGTINPLAIRKLSVALTGTVSDEGEVTIDQPVTGAVGKVRGFTSGVDFDFGEPIYNPVTKTATVVLTGKHNLAGTVTKSIRLTSGQ